MDRLPRLIDYPSLIRQVKLSSTEAYILQHLQSNGSQRGTDLVKLTGLTTSAITQICDKLEKEQLIVRKRSDQDRRYVHVCMTDKGTLLLEHISEMRSERIVETIEGLTDADAEQMLDTLEQLSDLIRLQRKRT